MPAILAPCLLLVEPEPGNSAEGEGFPKMGCNAMQRGYWIEQASCAFIVGNQGDRDIEERSPLEVTVWTSQARTQATGSRKTGQRDRDPTRLHRTGCGGPFTRKMDM